MAINGILIFIAGILVYCGLTLPERWIGHRAFAPETVLIGVAGWGSWLWGCTPILRFSRGKDR